MFGAIAFYGVISDAHLASLIGVMWAVKVGIEILGLPLSVRLANRLKKSEKIDRYDTNTDFGLFDWDVHYGGEANRFVSRAPGSL